MELEALVRTVTQEILRQLNTGATKPKIVILARKGAPLKALPPELCQDAELLYLDDSWREEEVQRWIMPCLSCNQLADLSQGKAADEACAALLNLVLRGYAIEVLAFEYKQYLDTAPEALRQIYETQEKIIAGFGVRAFQAETPKCARIRQKLVTEQDIRAMIGQGILSIALAPECLVTPLAAETARDHHIVIHRKQRCL